MFFFFLDLKHHLIYSLLETEHTISCSLHAHAHSETGLPRVTQGSHYCLYSPLIAEADGREKRQGKWGDEEDPRVEKQGCV